MKLLYLAIILAILAGLYSCSGGNSSESPGQYLTGEIVPPAYFAFLEQIRPTIEAKVGKLPERIEIVAGTKWEYRRGTIYVDVNEEHEYDWKAAIIHEMAHAAYCQAHPENPYGTWDAETVAEGSMIVCGYPRQEEIVLAAAEYDLLETDYSYRVRYSFAAFLITTYGESVIRQIVSSKKMGWEAITEVTGGSEEVVKKRWRSKL